MRLPKTRSRTDQRLINWPGVGTISAEILAAADETDKGLWLVREVGVEESQSLGTTSAWYSASWTAIVSVDEPRALCA